MSQQRPLDQVSSIKAKLGLLVGSSVVLSTLVVSLAGQAGVPWLLAVPVAVGLALAVTQLLAVGMTAPLREMITATARMARGDYRVRVTATSTDEVGQLARSFNAMAEDLAGVDQQRRDLVATVSHELRTPLAGALATMENLADGVVPADAETLAGVNARLQRLSGLVDDLLDLSRVEGGVTPLGVAPTPLAPVLRSAVEAARAARPGVPVDVVVEPADLTVIVDAGRLEQVVLNLVDNALRHSPADGVVQVRAAGAPGAWTLEVTDDGVGVPPAERERIFRSYGTSDAEGGGTGLGLAISRRLVDLHGGRLTVVDRADGRPGACFRAEFAASALPVHDTENTGGTTMTTTPTPAPAAAPLPSSTTLPLAGPLGDLLSFPTPTARPRLVGLAAAVGLLAGIVLPMRDIGLGASLVVLAAEAVLLWVLRDRMTPFRWTAAGLAAVLACVPAWRASYPLMWMALFTAALLAAAALTDGRKLADLATSAIAWGLGPVRGLPWLGRSLAVMRGGASAVAVARTVVLSLIALAVFGLLLTSGDALMGSWASAVVPDLSADKAVFRLFVAIFAFAVVLGAIHVALAPVSGWSSGRERHTRRFEWLAPVLVIDLLLVVFVVAQASAFFGGHDYVARTTGLTYADYVHQGFGQLTAVTVLTLLVVALVTPHVSSRPGDRAWMLGSVGLMCALTLVVVGSALHRMALYQQAYGYTVLRIAVDAFEGWLGLLVVLVMVVGPRRSSGWLPRTALLTGVVVVLGFVVINPDAWVAHRNLDRFHETGRLDATYLHGLSADAAPTILRDTSVPGRCLVVRPGHDDLFAGNLGRSRASSAWRDATARSDAECGRWFARMDALMNQPR